MRGVCNGARAVRSASLLSVQYQSDPCRSPFMEIVRVVPFASTNSQQGIVHFLTRDGHLTKKEFKLVLEKLNYEKADDETVNAVFYVYD